MCGQWSYHSIECVTFTVLGTLLTCMKLHPVPGLTIVDETPILCNLTYIIAGRAEKVGSLYENPTHTHK